MSPLQDLTDEILSASVKTKFGIDSLHVIFVNVQTCAGGIGG